MVVIGYWFRFDIVAETWDPCSRSEREIIGVDECSAGNALKVLEKYGERIYCINVDERAALFIKKATWRIKDNIVQCLWFLPHVNKDFIGFDKGLLTRQRESRHRRLRRRVHISLLEVCPKKFGRWHILDNRLRLGMPEPSGRPFWKQFDEAMAALAGSRGTQAQRESDNSPKQT